MLHSRQVTALGNTKLLERVSSGLVAIRNLFSQFDINKDNVIERDEFARVRPICHASSMKLQVSVMLLITVFAIFLANVKYCQLVLCKA